MILDLFAGPGGWSEGLRMLGQDDIGVEWDLAACQTRVAAGHRTILADVEHLPRAPFAGKVTGLIASPPCQDFSNAGKRAGRLGTKGRLIDLVPEWVDDLRPEWVACEQVPPCVDIWREHAWYYRKLGYSTWVGTLNAANFGVPQTRIRAILIASRVGAAHPPEPTHAKHPEPGLFGTREPWVTMAQALGWGDSLVGFPRRADTPSNQATGVVTIDGTDYRERDLFPTDGPAQVVTEKARSWQRWELSPGLTHKVLNRRTYDLNEPSPAIAFGHNASAWEWRERRHDQSKSGEGNPDWPLERPATTLATRDLVPDPGANANRFNGLEKSRNDGYKITPQEALVLQSFPADYPLQGSRTKKFEQVGNAVPPRLAAHVVAALTGQSMEQAA